MTSQRNVYPSLDMCEVCKWKDARYNIIDAKGVTQRNKTSTTSENTNNPLKKKCFACGVEIPDEKKLEKDKCTDRESQNAVVSWDICQIKLLLLVVAVVILAVFGCVFSLNPKASGNILDSELSKLMKKYPNQSPELWRNVLKITNATKPHVHALILLYRGNSEVAECFAKDLVTLINKIINNNGFLIYKERSEAVEYGVELNHYLGEVRKHKHMIVLQLNKISGNTARMFHALCDETPPSSVKPSYFIFTVEDGSKEEGTEVRRPLARAGHILRSSWSNLMENELHPLISRVVRNVAEILPENVTC